MNPRSDAMNGRWFSHPIWPAACAALTAAVLLTAAQPAAAQPGWVLSHQKISDTQGGFTGRLDNVDWFGKAVASLGDLDGDGVGDLVVGARNDDDGGGGGFAERGAVWVLFLNTDGTVKSHQKISDTQGGFRGGLDNSDLFGNSAVSLGDLDGDGVTDLAVGAPGDADGGGFGRGAVWVLFLKTDGTVKSQQKISATQGGFTGRLDRGDLFGWSVAALGDLDRDGVSDLAVGAWLDDDGGTDRGAVWVLFLNKNGTVKSHQKISDTEGGFTGILDNNDVFGFSVGSLGDLDRDGASDLAVGATNDDDGGNDRGAVWMLFLNTDGTVKSHQKISDTEGAFTGTLDNGDHFGSSAASLGDLDGDGVTDLAVGAEWDDDGGSNRGAVWVLFLNTGGTVKSHQKISSTEGGFTGILDDGDLFGNSAVSLGDLDGDGVTDLAVGAPDDDDGGRNRGAVWVLFLDDGVVRFKFDFPDGVPELVDPAGGTRFRVVLEPVESTPKRGSGLLHVDSGGGFEAVAMTEIEENVYEAVFGPIECAKLVKFYVSARTTEEEIVRSPAGAPHTSYEALAGFEIIVALQDDFEDDLGWTVENKNVSEGGWVRAIPKNVGDGSPPKDFDGSGKCYVTGAAQDVDLDGGPTRLISKTLDLSRGVFTVSYAYWFVASSDDTLKVHVSNNAGETWVLVVSHERSDGWETNEFNPADFVELTDKFQIRFAARDLFADSLVEAGLDALVVTGVDCDRGCDPCDTNCDGSVDLTDVEPFIELLLGGDPCDTCSGDTNNDGSVDLTDVEPFIECLLGG